MGKSEEKKGERTRKISRRERERNVGKLKKQLCSISELSPTAWVSLQDLSKMRVI